MVTVLQKCLNNPFLGSCLTELVQACLFSSGLCAHTVCCGIAITQNALLQWVDTSQHGLPLKCLVPFKYIVPVLTNKSTYLNDFHAL